VASRTRGGGVQLIVRDISEILLFPPAQFISIASIVPYQAFKTADGDILIGGGNDRLFGIMCDRLGKPEWKTDGRFITNSLRVKNRVVLEGMIEEATKRKSTKEWLDIFDESGMPYAAVNDIQGTLNHEHGTVQISYLISYRDQDEANFSGLVLARNMVTEVDHPTCGPMKLVNTPVKYSYSTPSIRTPPPTLGQHTDEVLRDVLGLSESDISSLKGEGIVA